MAYPDEGETSVSPLTAYLEQTNQMGFKLQRITQILNDLDLGAVNNSVYPGV